MMSKCFYQNPVEIHFGSGIMNTLSSVVSGKALLITTEGSTKRGVSQRIEKILGLSLVALFDKVSPNPTFKTIQMALRELKSLEYDVIIAVGGGSVIDTAKAIAAAEGFDNEDWLDEHLKGKIDFPEGFTSKPLIAIPTTAGTGSEVTMWATIWDMEEKQKYSLSHPMLYPKVALLDPELTITLPKKETIYSGLDALSHAMEAIWNKNHNAVSDEFALKSIELICRYLPELSQDLSNIELRTFLLRASLFAGKAFSNTKTALAHSISYPLTAHFGLPHGLACAVSLPYLLKLNGDRAEERIIIMAEALGADKNICSMVSAIVNLFKKLELSICLSDYGINENKVELIVNLAIASGRADNNIVDIEKAELVELVEQLF